LQQVSFFIPLVFSSFQVHMKRMHPQTKIFTQVVKAFMLKSKVCVQTGTSCAEAISQMADLNAPCAIVMDSHGKLAGILRLSSVLKDIVFKVTPQTLIEDVMDLNVQGVGPDEYLYYAIGRMRRQHLKELVVVDDAMHPLGIIHLDDAIEISANPLLQQIDRFSAEGDLESLCALKTAQVEIAHDLFEENLPISQIQHLLSHVNNDIYSRIINDTLRNMQAEGWGHPPVDFCVIVMGSGGRGENYLYPDQDNGFILDDYPDEDHNQVDQFFRELAERMCDALNYIGFPYCTGNVMARNPLWRKSLSQWMAQVQLWGRKRNATALRLADIFFDFQPVWGKESLAKRLREHLLKSVKENHFFLLEMHHSQVDHTVALGLLGRLKGEVSDTPHGGYIDMKYRASLPLVESVRLLSLKAGLKETSTLARIEKLHTAGLVRTSEQEDLISAFMFITQLLLKRQVQTFKSHQPVRRFINPKNLSKREKQSLIDCLTHIDQFRKRIKAEFTGDVF
jgi:CBS domain-containing protein